MGVALLRSAKKTVIDRGTMKKKEIFICDRCILSGDRWVRLRLFAVK